MSVVTVHADEDQKGQCIAGKQTSDRSEGVVDNTKNLKKKEDENKEAKVKSVKK